MKLFNCNTKTGVTLRLLVTLLPALLIFNSCKKDSGSDTGGGGTGVAAKPKLGTKWVYNYYTYYGFSGGGVATSGTTEFLAKKLDTLGGETWLRVVDVAADTTVFLLNEKSGGLFQYTNNNSYLLCKSPALVNDAYTTYNSGATESFVVKAVKDTLPTGIGDIPANYYEGSKGGYIIDKIWYNENAWIVRKEVYRLSTFPATNYYKYSSLFLNSIVY